LRSSARAISGSLSGCDEVVAGLWGKVPPMADIKRGVHTSAVGSQYGANFYLWLPRSWVLMLFSRGESLLLCSEQGSSNLVRDPLSRLLRHPRAPNFVSTSSNSPTHSLTSRTAGTSPGRSQLCFPGAPLLLALATSSVKSEHSTTPMSTFTLHR
jgi:hypothetical protein